MSELPVPDFYDPAHARDPGYAPLRRYADAGMHVVHSTEPLDP